MTERCPGCGLRTDRGEVDYFIGGYLINFVPIKADGNAGAAEVFADGFLDKATGRAMGRPVDVANLPDGSILVSDDYAGAIYRIGYER